MNIQNNNNYDNNHNNFNNYNTTVNQNMSRDRHILYESEPRRALYIGRFQMLHNGHLSVLKFIESQNDVDEIVIGIGSSQYSRFNKSFEAPLLINPFTYDEREAYVKKVFEDNIRKPYKIYSIMDQHDMDRWVKHVFTIVPKINYIYTNSLGEIDAFSKAGYECRKFPVTLNYNATLIRELMANDGHWEKYVPHAVEEVIRKKQLDAVVKELFVANTSEVDAIHKNRLRRKELSYEDFVIQEKLNTEKLNSENFIQENLFRESLNTSSSGAFK